MNEKSILKSAVFACCLTLFITCQCFADIENEKTLSPYFFIENSDPALDQFPLKETDVTVNVSGVIADVVVTQKYTNNGTRPINARYIFPASTRAAVHGMKMIIGGKVITAKIMEKKAAQTVFNKAKKEGKNASLLNQQRPNVFSMNVANIMPKDSIDIELRYTELLVPTDSVYEFVYPTVVGPRYSNEPESSAQETDKWVKNPYLKQNTPDPTRFNMTVNVSSGIGLKEIFCKTHQTTIDWENETLAHVLLANAEQSGGDRDFILNYRLSGEKIESGLLLHEGREENYFLLMVQPPKDVRPADIPPREYIFIVDISGSMHGFPLNTSKKLLKNLIGNLKPSDEFNVILFAGGSRVMSDSSVKATPQNINQAIMLIENQRGGGGTELYAALKKGLSLPRSENYTRTMLIITDGFISAEHQVFDLIQNNLNKTNVFAFGIGSSVNRYLIEGIARAGIGEPFIATTPADTKGVSEKFRKYVSSPVLTDITVTYDQFETYDIEPVSIPDLFARRPVIVFGKWRGNPRGTINLSGINGSGQYHQKFNISDCKPSETNSGLRYLWARNRLARLSDFSIDYKNPENKLQITNLGLTYNLLTAYTSFIAVNEVIRNPEGTAKEIKQPLPLPQNMSNLAIGVSCKNVPEPEMALLLTLFSLIAAGILMKKYYSIRRKTDGTSKI